MNSKIILFPGNNMPLKRYSSYFNSINLYDFSNSEYLLKDNFLWITHSCGLVNTLIYLHDNIELQKKVKILALDPPDIEIASILERITSMKDKLLEIYTKFLYLYKNIDFVNNIDIIVWRNTKKSVNKDCIYFKNRFITKKILIILIL